LTVPGGLSRRVAVGASVALAVLTVGLLSGCDPTMRSVGAGARTTAEASLPVSGPAPATFPTSGCPLSAAEVGQALGGAWSAVGMAGNACHYTQGTKTLTAGSVAAPRTAAGRQQALAQVRQPCQAGTTRPIAGLGFVCQQQDVVAGSLLTKDRLICVFTSVVAEPSSRAAAQTELVRLLSSASD
jgi:hypothetical protein